MVILMSPREVIALVEALGEWREKCRVSYRLDEFRCRAQEIRHANALEDLPDVDPYWRDYALDIVRARRAWHEALHTYGHGGCCG